MTTSQFSFRRLLLIGLFGVTFPVLVIGVYMTYIKASSEFFKNSQQNLSENAQAKVESIKQLVQALETTLLTARDSVTLRSGSQAEQEKYLNQIVEALPVQVECLQLNDISSKQVIASTCGEQLTKPVTNFNSTQNLPLTIISQEDTNTKPDSTKQVNKKYFSSNQLGLLLTTPVYSLGGKLTSTLSIKTALLTTDELKSDSGPSYSIIVDENGKIIAYPHGNNIGKNIESLPEKELIKKTLQKVREHPEKYQENKRIDLVKPDESDLRMIAGYSIIQSPVTGKTESKWIFFTITPISSELSSLEKIHQVLLLTMVILFILQLVLMFYLARTLGRPIDKLKDYALQIENFQSLDHPHGKVPNNFTIKEFNQLSEAFDQMLSRLKEWGKELEKAWENTKSANEIKDMFLATISHELRTPLNGIMGSIQLVKDDFCDSEEEEKEFLARAHKEACRLLDIIDDILDISKIQEGKLSVTIEHMDLVLTLKDVIECQKTAISQKGLGLNLPRIQDQIMVYADEQRLRQVLINVLGNATKFTETGSITIIVEQQIASNQKNEHNGTQNGSIATTNNVVIKVIDTGIGIEPCQQTKLFRPFVMVDGSSTRQYRGSGLGLAISRYLMEEMGGTITLYSEGRGKGTVVEISFPLSASPKKSVTSNKILGFIV